MSKNLTLKLTDTDTGNESSITLGVFSEEPHTLAKTVASASLGMLVDLNLIEADDFCLDVGVVARVTKRPRSTTEIEHLTFSDNLGLEEHS